MNIRLKAYLDTGCSQTVIKDLRFFVNYEEQCVPLTQLEGNVRGSGKGIGDAFFKFGDTIICAHDAVYYPTASANLMCDMDIFNSTGWRVDGGPNGYTFYDPKTKTAKIHCPRLSNNLCEITLESTEPIFKTNDRVAFVVKDLKYDETLIHNLFGHPGASILERFVNGTTLDMNLKNMDFRNIENCECCNSGKFRRAAYIDNVHEFIDATGPGEFLHMDTSGRIEPSYTYAGKVYNYFMLIVDDFSRFCWVRLLEHKSDCLEQFIELVTMLEKQYNFETKRLRSDNAKEFKSEAMNSFLKSKGIIVDDHVSRDPQTNSVAERYIGSLKAIARPMLHNTNLPGMMWGPLILHAADIKNIWPTNNPRNEHVCAYEMLHRVKPLVTHYRMFGCSVKVPLYTTKMIDGTFSTMTADKIYLGAHSPKVFKVIDPKTGRMSYHRFRDAEFNCDEYPVYKGHRKSTFDTASDTISQPDEAVRANARAEEAVSRNKTHLDIHAMADNAVVSTRTHEILNVSQVYHICVHMLC